MSEKVDWKGVCRYTVPSIKGAAVSPDRLYLIAKFVAEDPRSKAHDVLLEDF